MQILFLEQKSILQANNNDAVWYWDSDRYDDVSISHDITWTVQGKT